MEKIALIYSFNTIKTSEAAKLIIEEFDKNILDIINAEILNRNDFLKYNKFILGVPTWFEGELPNYWDEFIPEIEDMDLHGKLFAIFGNGDQVNYPDNFGDAVGLMAEILESRGGIIIGLTDTAGYTFEKSKALRNDKFLGLLLDFENQKDLNKSRINNWVNQLKIEFGFKS